MMSHGKQLEIYRERGELAPDQFIKQIIEFETLVAQVRKLQKKYFDKRDKQVLQESKEAEARLDRMLKDMGYDDQMNIF